LLFEFCKSC